mmetsp:Transcript_13699/g.39296  ORF Transcript_13699/g.39296 Transcript_13699/m.39296 type:complete len:245 (+) Transcript_13699:494-1228(+)
MLRRQRQPQEQRRQQLDHGEWPSLRPAVPRTHRRCRCEEGSRRRRPSASRSALLRRRPTSGEAAARPSPVAPQRGSSDAPHQPWTADKPLRRDVAPLRLRASQLRGRSRLRGRGASGEGAAAAAPTELVGRERVRVAQQACGCDRVAAVAPGRTAGAGAAGRERLEGRRSDRLAAGRGGGLAARVRPVCAPAARARLATSRLAPRCARRGVRTRRRCDRLQVEPPPRELEALSTQRLARRAGRG